MKSKKSSTLSSLVIVVTKHEVCLLDIKTIAKGIIKMRLPPLLLGTFLRLLIMTYPEGI